MGQTLKKKILMAPELISTQVGSFFLKAGFELHTELQPDGAYEFIVDDYKPELKKYPRVKTSQNLPAELQSQVRAEIDPGYFKEEGAQSLLARYYADFNDFNLVDHYSSQYKNIYTLKIQDYLNIGYFIDTIVVEAYKQAIDPDKIRSYLNTILPLALKAVEKQELPPHIDLSFSYSDEAFAVEASFSASSTVFKNEMAVLKDISDKTNFFDAAYFAKRERASFAAAWFRKEELKNTHARFFTEVSAKSLNEVSLSEINSMESPDSSVAYEPKKQNSDQSKKLQLARKFSLFIKNFRSKEEAAKPAADLVIADIDNYLSKYPRQEAINELDDEVKNFILKLVVDNSLFDGLTDYVQKISSSNLDSHVDEIQRIIGGKSLEDIAEIIKISGSSESNDSEKAVVGGWTENLNEEQWKVKRSELVEQIKDEVTVIKSQGRNVVEDDIVRVVSDQLHADPNDVKTVVKGFVEEAVTTEVMKKEKLEEAFARSFTKIASAENDQVREKLEQQNQRMKKLMEQMKNEIIKLKNEKLLKSDTVIAPSDNSHELIELKQALSKSMELAKNKDKILEKTRSDLESIVQAKNDKIASLEMRIENLKDEFTKSAEFANEEKLEKLQVENKSLLARLELANRKVNIISENMDKQDTESSAKKEREIVTLKTNMQSAQSMIEKLKSERHELEAKLAVEKEKASKVREEKPEVKEKNMEQEILISSLSSDKRALEDKLKVQGMEIKKIEQKLKFTMAQLEEAHKKKGSTPSSGPKSNEAYIKQLENANSKLAEANSDLAEKKKELHKIKQENAIMNAKVAELEKKLANAEKKAA